MILVRLHVPCIEATGYTWPPWLQLPWPWTISSNGAGGPDRRAPPACGCHLAGCAHSTSPAGQRQQRPCRRRAGLGQHNRPALRELRLVWPRAPRRRSPGPGRAQCRRDEPLETEGSETRYLCYVQRLASSRDCIVCLVLDVWPAVPPVIYRPMRRSRRLQKKCFRWGPRAGRFCG